MSAAPKRSKKRNVLRTFGVLIAIFIFAVAGLLFSFQMGWFDSAIRNSIVTRIQDATGGTVELGKFHFDIYSLYVNFDGLTIHGREPEGTPPLFHADSIVAGIQIDSFWHKKVSLRELRISHPEIHVRFNEDGSSNLPALKPSAPGAKPFRARIFEFAIRHLQIENGTLLYNDTRTPVAAEGDRLNFVMDWSAPASGPMYTGKLTWQDFTFTARRYLPAASDLSLRFTFTPDAFHADQLEFRIAHTHFDSQIDVDHLAHPSVAFRYKGILDLSDVETIFRKPHAPSGIVDLSGSGNYGAGVWNSDGHYSAREIALAFQWFHDRGISSRGTFHAAHGQVVVPDFEATALGGAMHGRVNLALSGMKFHVESHAAGMSLAQMLAAVENPSFPVGPLHWDSTAQTDAITTWSQDFKHLESRGTTVWTPSPNAAAGKIPVTAHIDYDYVGDLRSVTVQPSVISTPTSKLDIRGSLGAADSTLEVSADLGDLAPWDDFINRLRGPNSEPEKITGSATWAGKLSGPLAGPTFTGHVHARNARYGSLYWDEIEGEMLYSPTIFQLNHGRAVREKSSAQIELALELDKWNFSPDSRWSLDADVAATPTQGLQEIFGWNAPVNGILSGQFHMRGTRRNPQLNGLFDLAQLEGYGWKIDRARGELNLDHEQVRISNAEVRFLPLETGRAAGVVTGNFALHFNDNMVDFDLSGGGIPIEDIRRIQSARLPLGGQLNFQLHGSGPILAPKAQGTLRVVDFRAGKEVLGSYDGKIDADGRRLRVELSSALPADRVKGWLELQLAGDFPISGELDTHEIDLDPLIQAGLHLEAVTGHSVMTGHFKISGSARSADSIAIDANISMLRFAYDYVNLENNGPVTFTYRRNEVRIDSANLRGTGSDFRISGFTRFAGDRAIGMQINGGVNLQLLGGFIPLLDARGTANVNTSIEGTLDRPRINGRMDVQSASATYDEFPAGLSNVTGAFVFDTNRLLFDSVHAETGGGQLLLSGSVSYGDGFRAMRYDLNARANSVRIRYPEGMSWLANGTLRFAGNLQAATISGDVTVDRVLMAEGFDLATLVAASKAPVSAPTTSSPFLRNLQFDIKASSAPDATVQWNGARFESDADLRVRGTWENPVLLGHIGLRNGELAFGGNRYQVSRGDIDFANPFRLDPILSIQATTHVSQYEVTLDLTGPASHLSTSFRSDPPLPSSDIISLLALGQPTEASSYRGSAAAQSQQTGATTLLSEAITSQLGGRVEKLFGISSFRVDPFLSPTSTQQNAATRVTVQQNLANKITITYSSNVTGSQEQVIQIEYQVRPDLSIVALRDINGTFSLDVVKKKRFK